MFLLFILSKGATLWMIFFQVLQSHSTGMVWGLSTTSKHFQASGPQRIETIQKPRRLIKRSRGFSDSFKPIRKFLRSKSTGCFEGGFGRDRAVSETPRPKKDHSGKVSFIAETPTRLPGREKAPSFPASPAPQRKFTRSSSIGSFMRHTTPDKIVNDALESKKQEAFEETGKDGFLVIEEPRQKSQSQTPVSSPEYEPLLRAFKTVQPVSPPKPKPKVGVLKALKGGLEKFLMKLLQITMSVCEGVSKMMRRKNAGNLPSNTGSEIKTRSAAGTGSAAEKSSAEETAGQSGVLDDMKMLGWELMLDPSKQDRVIVEIAGFKYKGPDSVMARVLQPKTNTLKETLEEKIPPWVSKDLAERSKDLPSGLEEYVRSLPEPRRGELTKISEAMFPAIVRKIPAKLVVNVGKVAQKYRAERLNPPVAVIV